MCSSDLGPTVLNSTLNVTSATYLSDKLTVNGSSTLLSNLNVSGNTILTGSLDVTGSTVLADKLTVNGTSTLLSNMYVSGSSMLNGSLNVSGKSNFRDDVNIYGNLNVAGTSNIFTTNSTLVIYDHILITSGSSINTALLINRSGTASIFKAVDVESGKLFEIDGDANTFTTGDLTVSGTTNLKSNLNVSGNTILTGTLTVTGATILNSSLNVTGTTYLSDRLTVKIGRAHV